MSSGQQPNLITYGIVLLVVVVMLAFRARRMARRRPLTLDRLWIIPAVFIAIAMITLVQFPPHALEWLWLALALAIGVGLGWQRGRLMDISVDDEAGRLMVQASPWAIFFLIILVVVRTVVKSGLGYEAQAGGLSPALINDVFVVFAVGLFATQRVEMYLRGSRLIRTGGQPTSAGPAD